MKLPYRTPVRFNLVKTIQITSLEDGSFLNAIAEFEKFYRENKGRNFEIFIDISPAILGIYKSNTKKLKIQANIRDNLESLLLGLSSVKVKAVGITRHTSSLIRHSFIDKFSDLNGNIVTADRSNNEFINIIIFDVGSHKPTSSLNVRFCCEKDYALREYLSDVIDCIAIYVEISICGLGSFDVNKAVITMGLISAAIFVLALILQ